MRGCLQTLAMLVAIFFVITAVMALFAVNLMGALTDRDRVREALQLGSFAEEIGPIMVVDLLRSEARARGVIVDDVDISVIQEAIAEVITPDWIDEQAGTAVDAVYDVLETGEAETADLLIDTRPIIERLRGAPGQRMIQTLLQSLPTCPDPQPSYNLNAGDLSIPGCLPASVSVAEATRVIHARAVEAIDQNPALLEAAGEVPLSLLGGELQTPEGIEQLRRTHLYFILARRWNWLFWLLPAGCLLLIALLAVRSFSEWGYWWGWPLLLSGVFALALALVLPAAFLLLVPSTMEFSPETAELRRITDAFLRQAFGVLTDLWLGRVYLQAGMMTAAGVLLVAVGWVSRKRKH